MLTVSAGLRISRATDYFNPVPSFTLVQGTTGQVPIIVVLLASYGKHNLIFPLLMAKCKFFQKFLLIQIQGLKGARNPKTLIK